MKKVFIILTLRSLFACIAEACLLQKSPTSSECAACPYGSFYDFPLDWPGGEVSFEKTLCQTQTDVAITIVKYVSPTACISGSLCDGSSPENAFDNLMNALIAVWKEANKYKSPNVEILLLSNGQPEEKADFFINKVDFKQEFQYLFRRLYANISIKPLYCNLREEKGCLKNNSLKPAVFVRTESFYFFVAKNLFIENLIFDGADLLPGQRGLVNSTNLNKRVCSEEALDNIHKSENFDASNLNEVCGIKGRVSGSNISNGFGLFNFEPIVDCPTCLANKSEGLFLRGVIFRNLHSFGGNFTMNSLFMSQAKQKFFVRITDTVFTRLAPPMGIFYGLLTVPTFYAFNPAVYLAISSTTANPLILENCTIYEYNYFSFKYSEPSNIFSFFNTPLGLQFLRSFIGNNSGELGDTLSLFSIELSVGSHATIINLEFNNNTIYNNSLPYFLNFTREANQGHSKHRIVFT